MNYANVPQQLFCVDYKGEEDAQKCLSNERKRCNFAPTMVGAPERRVAGPSRFGDQRIYSQT